MKKLFTSVAAFAVAGSMAAAEPAYARDDQILRDVIRQGSQIYRDQQRLETQRRRDELRAQQQYERTQAQRERDAQRGVTTRSNDCETNQIRARGQDYKYTSRAPVYQACDNQAGGRYTNGGNYSSDPYAREAQIRQEAGPRATNQFQPSASGAAINLDNCLDAKEGGKAVKLCQTEDGSYVKVAPSAAAPAAGPRR